MSPLAQEYAEKIATAVRKDQISRTAGFLRKSSDLASSSHLARALQEIGREFDTLVNGLTLEKISEADKQQLAADIAEIVDWDNPKTLRRLVKAGSVDSLMTMSQEMESLFLALRK